MNVLEFKKKNKETLKSDKTAHTAAPAGASAIGIDLGTTNSVVSIFVAGEKQPTTLVYEGSNLIPSIVYYDKEKEEVVIGSKAKKFLKELPSEVIKSTKRSMGKKSSVFSSNEKNFSAEETATFVLKYIVSHPVLLAEKEKFGGVWAVVTVPAHFDDAARTATILAAENAGIFVLRIINEPTAAALAYSMLEENEKTSQEYLAVFDFGGGTFDVSIVEKSELTFNVLSSEGDINLGGDDVDEVIADFLIKQVQPPFVARRASKNSELYRKISMLAQEAKKTLQIEASVHIQDHNLDGKNSSLDVELERSDFEEMVFSILQKTLFLTESSIQSAKKSPKNISRILLVGGSTRLNLVRNMLTDYFPCLVDARLEPDLAVSWGASLQAAMILGIQVDTILVDVCSHSLGIGVVESGESAQENLRLTAKKYGLSYPISEAELENKLGDKIDEFNLEIQRMLRVAPILYRNSALPAKKSEFFNTVYHNQGAVHVVIVQGEGDIVGDNRLIGSFLFRLEQPCPKGSRCEIQLTYDVNGMVQVFARQLGTNNECRAHFDSRTGQVQGWSKVNSDSLELSDETKHDDTLIEPESNKVLSMRFRVVDNSFSVEKEQSHHLQDNNFGNVVNAITMRAKRTLLKLDKNSEEYMQILTLAKHYSQLLESAQKGEDNDSQVEDLEEQLLSCLEGK
ncbi:MAG: Hsp70 family protein [Bdellovibrionota bacterium]